MSFDRPPVPIFIWAVERSRDHGIIAEGQSDTLEHAMKAARVGFYKHLTRLKLLRAQIPTPAKDLVLEGLWVPPSVYDDYPNPKPLKVDIDKENRTYFVMGLPIASKQMHIRKPLGVKKQSGSLNNPYCAQTEYILQFPQYKIIGDYYEETLSSHAELVMSMDWWVHRPEQYIEGEVYCEQCDILVPALDTSWRTVRGIGLRCGPCIDHIMDSDSSYDKLFDT